MKNMLPETIYAIQHLAFEDLASWEDILYSLGYRVRYFQAGVDNLTKALQYSGLTVILGGPIGIDETDHYPFLQQEIDLLKARLANNLPTLGICLGAQLIAAASGARVYAGTRKEIGWSTLSLAALPDQPLQILKNVAVLHWHGDTFELPPKAELLASTADYPNQAFRIGKNILALQFHPEIDAENLEQWLIGHCCELKQAHINISHLRADNQKYAASLAAVSGEIIQQFIAQLELP